MHHVFDADFQVGQGSRADHFLVHICLKRQFLHIDIVDKRTKRFSIGISTKRWVGDDLTGRDIKIRDQPWRDCTAARFDPACAVQERHFAPSKRQIIGSRRPTGATTDYDYILAMLLQRNHVAHRGLTVCVNDAGRHDGHRDEKGRFKRKNLTKGADHVS